MYHPLLVFDGSNGQLITALLRPGNRHPSRGAIGTLQRLIRQIRRRCPNASIVVRGDSGFCGPRLLEGLERLDRQLGEVEYVLGVAKNPRLNRLLEPTMAQARERQTGRKSMALFTSFEYAAGSWTRRRRVLDKAQITAQGENPRFVLTSLRGFEPEMIYRAYCERGRCELWIKDFKNAMAADRLSCCRFLANGFRLLLHAAAYRRMHALRKRVAPLDAKLGRAQMDTLRLRLLRVAAQVTQSVRRILVRLPRSFPEAALFRSLAVSFSPAMPTAPS